MSHKFYIAPSILSADFSRLGEEIRDVENSGCDVVHVDVMDGHFVPNLTMGPPVIRHIRKTTKIPLDVHLMIEKPEHFVEEYRKAGADWLTVHVEACGNAAAVLEEIRALGAKAGISLRPDTPVETLKPLISLLDLVLVMTVEPGFGGQAFMPDMIGKVKKIRSWGYQNLISVDGGITDKTAVEPAKAGADVYVAGTYIFGSKDRRKAISDLKEVINKNYGS